MNRLRIGLAQLDTAVGDLVGNVAKIIAALEASRDRGADLVIFPELAVTGSPLGDLALRPDFIDANRSAIREVAAAAVGITTVVGFIDAGAATHDAAAVVHDGEIVAVHRKHVLSRRGRYDDARYFRPGTDATLIRLRGVDIGITIGEEVVRPEGGPLQRLIQHGASLVLNLDATPFRRGGWAELRARLVAHAVEDRVAIARVGQVGGQDGLVFDGGSIVLDAAGTVRVEAEPFREALVFCDLELPAAEGDDEAPAPSAHGSGPGAVRRDSPAPEVERILLPMAARHGDVPALARPSPVERDDVSDTYEALVVGLRDYVRKNGFEQVLLGISGGLDSALVATIAVDALGADAVRGVWLPSRYSSELSRTDASALADALGIELLTVPIEPLFEAALATLAPVFEGREPDLTEENLQARIRGMILMALSNKFGGLVLVTSNKSEQATGYSTLYGDMAGGLAVLGDVWKLRAYELARWRNGRGAAPVIPESTLTRAPSAELRPDQRDVDSLPPYEVLDPILERYVELGWGLDEFRDAGYDLELVRRITAMVDRNEYKRRQAAPVIRVTGRAFGIEWDLPPTTKRRGL